MLAVVDDAWRPMRKPERPKWEEVKSSQVKSSQDSKWRSPIRLLWCLIAGASDREGRSRRNRHHWIAPSRGINPIVLILIIAAPQGFIFVPFSGSLQYSNAKPIQADDGSDRGPARGLFRWAKASVGSGDRRRRASSARGPSPTTFGVLGLTRARQSIFGQATSGRLARRRQEWSRSFLRCAPHTPPSISYACALARDTQVRRRWQRERQTGGESSRERGCL